MFIIGGGIAELSAAWSLREHQASLKAQAFEVVVLERHDRTGGNIKTEKTDGFLI